MYGQEPAIPRQAPHPQPGRSVLFWAAHIWGLPLELLWRRWFGSRYIDWLLLPAAIWPMIFASLLFPEYDVTWTLWGFWVIVLLGVYHAIMARRLDRRGFLRHSQYSGYPQLCRWFPRHEVACKNRWEPAITLLLALPALAISPSLMLFLVGACLAGVIKARPARVLSREPHHRSQGRQA